MNNDYIFYGSLLNQQLDLNNNQFVFINGFSEFIGTSIFIFLLITILCNFNLKLANNYAVKKNVFFITTAICISLFFAYLLSIGVHLGIISAIINNEPTLIVSTNPLLFNPAFTIAYMLKGINYNDCDFYIPLVNGIIYILFEFLGAFIGAICAYYFYHSLIKNESNLMNVKSCFYTFSSNSNNKINLAHETINTTIFMILIIAVLVTFGKFQGIEFNVVKQLLICISLWVILIALGGVIGNALNPFRDLCPRLVYLLFFHKKDHNYKADWKYAYVPIVGPILGCIIGVIIMPGFLY